MPYICFNNNSQQQKITMKTIEEVMSEVNSVFGLKVNQSLTYDAKMLLLRNIIEREQVSHYRQGKKDGVNYIKKIVSDTL